MMTNNLIQQNNVYVLDTNIFINLKIFLPPEMFVLFYEKLFSSIKEGKVVLLECVLKELEKGTNNELDIFLQKCKDNNLITKTDSFIERGVEINNNYKMIDETSRKSEADTIIIAFCEQSEYYILLTREGYKKENDFLYKIPDVCKILKVKFNRKMEDFYNYIGYKEKE